MKELKNLQSLNNKKLLVVLPISKAADIMLNEAAFQLAQQTNPIDLLVLAKGLDVEELKHVDDVLSGPTVTISKTDDEGKPVSETVTSEKTLNYVIETTTNDTFAKVYNEAFNYAVANGYEYLSIVEQEDIVEVNWFENFNIYSTEKPGHQGFFPLVREVINGNFTGHVNEANWCEGMSEVAGVFDLQLLLRFSCINLAGGVLNVNAVKEYSENVDGYYKPMKEGFKVSEQYEFFLRMIYNDLKLYTVPRFGYRNRIDSSVDYSFSSKIQKDIITSGAMSQEEYKYWVELAKKEYFFDSEEDRNIGFKKEEVVA